MVMIVNLDVFPENAVISNGYRVQAVKGTARIEKRIVTDAHRAAPPPLFEQQSLSGSANENRMRKRFHSNP